MSRRTSPIWYQAAVLLGQSHHGRPRHLLAEATGIAGRQPLSMPDAEVARKAAGYERGTITPLGSVRPWPVIADERVRGREITPGAGEHGLILAVDADEILQALDASVADIFAPEAVASAGR